MRLIHDFCFAQNANNWQQRSCVIVIIITVCPKNKCRRKLPEETTTM